MPVHPVLAIGKFDALHLGHRALAARAAAHGPVALLSFSGMPAILGWEPRLPLLAASDRQRVLADWSAGLGTPVEEVVLPFAGIRHLDAAGFLGLLRQELATGRVVVGEDFRGGRDRAADAAAFARIGTGMGLPVEVVPTVDAAGGPASSSRARTAITAGDLDLAARVLGRRHRLLGRVVRGDGRGGAIGVPTANLGARENLEPGPGVYAAWALVGGDRWPAAVNIGRLPTIAPDRPLTVEAHLIGFAGDLYGRALALEFTHRLREERRFPGLAALVAQIRADLADAADRLATTP